VPVVAARRRRLIADAPPLLVLSAGLLLGAALLNPLVSSSREVRATVSAPPPLQAWIDATATGGTLNAPAGTYSGPVVISRPMVIDGKGAITIDGGGTTLGISARVTRTLQIEAPKALAHQKKGGEKLRRRTAQLSLGVSGGRLGRRPCRFGVRASDCPSAPTSGRAAGGRESGRGPAAGLGPTFRGSGRRPGP